MSSDRADHDLVAAAKRVDVVDLAGAIIARPRRAIVSTAGQLALALAFESAWEIAVEAQVLIALLDGPITIAMDVEGARARAQADHIRELFAAMTTQIPTTEEE